MAWVTRGTAEDHLTTAEIDRQEDRAAAIIAAAFFEDRLTLAIRERLVNDPRVVNPLFKGAGPLASFAAKIDLAYLLGIYGAPHRAKLHTIRNIRNEFAHNLAPLTFESQKIEGMCATLYKPVLMGRIAGAMKQSPDFEHIENFDKFIDEVFGAMAALPDTPRNSYMVTLKFSLLAIEMLTHAEMAEKLAAEGEQTATGELAPSPDRSSPPRPQPFRTGSRIRKKRASPRRSSPE